ncbi:MAG: tetratricopeptide repeat protein, partial [Candidatus Latescibacteria bacterium]|nr:tetratricopeptide repeat protein [Candidatus Latescibacterota bacterium]
MRPLWKCIIPVLILTVSSGCASSGKKAPVSAEEQQQKRMAVILEQVDHNAATILENKTELTEISRRLNDLENKTNTTMTDNNATIQEIRENQTFMNDQIVRLDSSIRTKRPSASRPGAASAFKPGGFDVNASYKGARDEYYSRRYESAISGFTELLTVAPNNDLADNAQYWIGECYYAIGNFEKALDAFEKVFNFPDSNKLSDAQIKLGLTYLKLGNTNNALEEFRAT